MKKLLIKVVCILVAAGALLGATAASNMGSTAGDIVSAYTATVDQATPDQATKDQVSTPDQETVPATEKPTEAKPTEAKPAATAAPTEAQYINDNSSEDYDWYDYNDEDEDDYTYTPTYDEEEDESDNETYSDYSSSGSSPRLYSPSEFQLQGVINWGGWSWTYYSEKILPGDGLYLPGRHTDSDGYICDGDGYICIASSSLSRYTVVDTPFGKQGKVYDCGCASHILDVYVSW